MIINELITKLSFNLDQRTINRYESNMRRMEKQAVTATSSMQRSFSRSSSSIGKMLNFNVKLNGIRGAHSQLNGLNSTIGKISGSMKMMAAGFIGFSALSNVTSGFLTNVKSIEGVGVALENAYKSPTVAANVYKDLTGFANRYGQQVDEVATAHLRLKNLDLDASKNALLAYGNIAAGIPGKKIIDFAEAIADAITGENERLKEFGIKSTTTGNTTTYKSGNTSRTVEKGNQKQIEKALQDIANAKFAGLLEKKAKTLEGRMTSLGNRFSMLSKAVWETDLGPNAIKAVEWVTKFMDKVVILAQKRLPALIEKTIDFAKSLGWMKKYIEPAAIGLGMIATAMIAMKGFALASGVVSFLGFLGSIGGATVGFITTAFGAISGFLTLASGAGLAGTLGIIGTTLGGIVTAALPIIGAILTGGVIVGAIAAIVALGVKLADYWARGDVALKGLHEKFPILAEGIKIIGDEMAAWWPIIQSTLIGGFNLLWPVIKWCFEGVLVPALGNSLKWLGMVSKWIRTAFEFWMPSLTGAVSAFGRMFETIWFEFIKPIFDLIGGGITNVSNAIGGMINLLKQAAGMNPDSGAGAATGQNVLGLTKNDSLATNLVNASRQVNTLKGRCLEAVWKVQQAALNGTSKITALHAADAANQLAADKRFREIKVTQAMLTDPKYIKLLHGATVIYNRQSGFSPVSGHAEIWDMVSKTANYGRGAMPLNRSAQMLANARVFIPASGSMPANTAAMYGANGNANLTINVNASNSSNPELIKTKTKNGVTEALNKAKGLGSGATTPTRGAAAFSQ